MIKPADSMLNTNGYEQNQGGFIDQSEIRHTRFDDISNFNSNEAKSNYLDHGGMNNFRLDEYHRQPESYNNYQIPSQKYQDIEQFVSNNDLNKKDPQFNESLNLRPNEIINDSKQDDLINQVDDRGKQMDSLSEKSKKRENNGISPNRPYKINGKDSNDQNIMENDQNTPRNGILYALPTNQSNYAYQQSLDMNDQQELDYSHQGRCVEQNNEQFYSHRQIQPNCQIDYRQPPPPSQYDIQTQQNCYSNDFYTDAPSRSTIQSSSMQPQQQHYYNQQIQRCNDPQHLQSQPSFHSLNQAQYRSYQQEDYPPSEMKQELLNQPYQAQQRHPQYMQYPQTPPPPPSSQQQTYSQQSNASQQQPPIYPQHQAYQPPPPPQVYPPSQQPAYSQPPSYQQQGYSQYSPQNLPNAMLADIKDLMTKLLNIMSSRQGPSNMSDFRQPPIGQSQQDQPPLSSRSPLAYPNNSYQQPQSQNLYYDRNYQPQDPYNYHQPYSQESNQFYSQDQHRSLSPSQYYHYPPQEYPKNTALYYQQSQNQQVSEQQQQIPPNQQISDHLQQIQDHQMQIPPNQPYYNQTDQYQYSAPKQPMQAINPIMDENDHSPALNYQQDSNSYSDYDDQRKIVQSHPYPTPIDVEDNEAQDSNNNIDYDESDDESVNTRSKAKRKSNKSGNKKNRDKRNSKSNNAKKSDSNITKKNSNHTTNSAHGSSDSNEDNGNKNQDQSDNENLDAPQQNSQEQRRVTRSTKNAEKESSDLFNSKKKTYKSQGFKLKMKLPQENVDGAPSPDQGTIVEETQGTFIRKGRGIFLRPPGFDEALRDENLIINPYKSGFQPSSYWEEHDQDLTFEKLVTNYFNIKPKGKITKFIFKLYNMLILTNVDERYKDIVGFNWYSDYVIAVNRLAASAMLNLSTSNYDVILPEMFDNYGFDEVTHDNFRLAKLDAFPDDVILKFYFHRDFLFSRKELTASELERMEVKKVVKRGRKSTKYPAQT